MLSLCLALGAAGCGGVQLKDNIINGFNDMLQYFSRHALTDEKDLQGDKTKGADAYTALILPNMKILTAPSMCLAERGWSVAAGIRLMSHMS